MPVSLRPLTLHCRAGAPPHRIQPDRQLMATKRLANARSGQPLHPPNQSHAGTFRVREQCCKRLEAPSVVPRIFGRRPMTNILRQVVRSTKVLRTLSLGMFRDARVNEHLDSRRARPVRPRTPKDLQRTSQRCVWPTSATHISKTSTRTRLGSQREAHWRPE